MLRFCLARSAEAFPDCKRGDAIERSVAAGAPAIRFEGLAPGSYALAVIHDENGNSRLDTFVGIPREGFGFSRNPKIGFGPPRVDAASFAVEGGAVSQQVRMRYLL